jgi:hypothetical protein
LFAEAARRGLTVEVRPGTPQYLSDAVPQVENIPQVQGRPAGQDTSLIQDIPSGQDAAAVQPAAGQGGKLIVAGEVVPLEAGQWLLADLPLGGDTIPVRHLAAALAQAEAQIYDIQRLVDGHAVLIAHQVSTPEAVGPAIEVLPEARGAFQNGPAASDIETLTMINAAVLARHQTVSTVGALIADESAARRQILAETLAGAESERLAWRDEAEELYRTQTQLRRRIEQISRWPLFRLERKLRHIAKRLRRRSGGRGQ